MSADGGAVGIGAATDLGVGEKRMARGLGIREMLTASGTLTYG